MMKLKYIHTLLQESNMPIVNSVYKSKELFPSEFFCPNCLVSRQYEIKPMSKGIILCPIPFMDANEPSRVLECDFCKNAFNPEILVRNLKSLIRLAGTAKYQLDRGISPGFLKLQFMSDGLNESFTGQLISLAQH